MKTIAANYLSSFIDTCVENGADKNALLRIVPGQTLAMAQKPTGLAQNRLPADVLLQVLKRAVEMTKKPEIGLVSGAQRRPSHFAELGHALLCSNTLRDVIKTNIRYQPLTQQIGICRLENHHKETHLVWESMYEDPENCRVLTDSIMAGYVFFGRWLLWSQDKDIVAVNFRHKKPDYATHYEEILQCPVYFSQPIDAVIFHNDMLDINLPQADPQIKAQMCQKLDMEMDRLNKSVSYRDLVMNYLQMDISTTCPDLEQIARRLGIGTRSLRRRLAEENTGFRELQEKVRKQKCVAMMHDELPFTEISHKLGYSQQSAFNRAFKGWFGVTPKKYIKTQQTAKSAFDQMAP